SLIILPFAGADIAGSVVDGRSLRRVARARDQQICRQSISLVNARRTHAELHHVGPRGGCRCWRRRAWAGPVKRDAALIAVESINLDTVSGADGYGESYQALNVAWWRIVERRDVVVGSENSQSVDGCAGVCGQNRVEVASVGIESSLACPGCGPVVPDRSTAPGSRWIGWFSCFFR